jgi:hypothetical protein
MISSLSSVLNMNIGIPACGVVSATISAADVIPGAVANWTNVGALPLGDTGCPLRVAWQEEQVVLTNSAPFCGSPIWARLATAETTSRAIKQVSRRMEVLRKVRQMLALRLSGPSLSRFGLCGNRVTPALKESAGRLGFVRSRGKLPWPRTCWDFAA